MLKNSCEKQKMSSEKKRERKFVYTPLPTRKFTQLSKYEKLFISLKMEMEKEIYETLTLTMHENGEEPFTKIQAMNKLCEYETIIGMRIAQDAIPKYYETEKEFLQAEMEDHFDWFVENTLSDITLDLINEYDLCNR